MHRKRAVWQSKKKKSTLLERDYLFFILSRARDIHTHAQFYRTVVILSRINARYERETTKTAKREGGRGVLFLWWFRASQRVKESAFVCYFSQRVRRSRVLWGEIELKDNGRFREKGRRRRRLETHALSLFLSLGMSSSRRGSQQKRSAAASSSRGRRQHQSQQEREEEEDLGSTPTTTPRGGEEGEEEPEEAPQGQPRGRRAQNQTTTTFTTSAGTATTTGGTTPSNTTTADNTTMDRNVRARVDQIFNSLIENVNEDARAGIASYIAQLARDTASGGKPVKKQQELLAEYAKSAKKNRQIPSSSEGGGGAVDEDATTRTSKKKKMAVKVPQKVEPTWREYATEHQLREFLNANDVPYDRAETWTKKMLLERCEQHLAKVSEPALKIGNELVRVIAAFEAWMHAIGKKNANDTFDEVEGEEDNELLSSSMPKLASIDTASEILKELRACEREATGHLDYIKNHLDPFKLMQYPAYGCSILDLPYVHVNLSNRVMLGLFPILKAASHGSEIGGKFYDLGQKGRNAKKKTGGNLGSTLGLDLVQSAESCMDYVFGIIGTSLNETNLTHPEKATKFLVELCALRDEWRCSSKDSVTPKLTMSFLQKLASDDSKLRKLYAAGEREDEDDEERRRIVMQLPPHALTQLHESFHGPTRPSSEYRVPVELTWECLWIPSTPPLKVLSGSEIGGENSDGGNHNHNNAGNINNTITNNNDDDDDDDIDGDIDDDDSAFLNSARDVIANSRRLREDFDRRTNRANRFDTPPANRFDTILNRFDRGAMARANDAHSARLHPYAGFPPMLMDDEDGDEEHDVDDDDDNDEADPAFDSRERRREERMRRLRILSTTGVGSARSRAQELLQHLERWDRRYVDTQREHEEREEFDWRMTATRDTDRRDRERRDRNERLERTLLRDTNRYRTSEHRVPGIFSRRENMTLSDAATILRSRGATREWMQERERSTHERSQGMRMRDDRFGRVMDLHSPFIPSDRARLGTPRAGVFRPNLNPVDIASVTHTVTNLVRKLRSIGPPPDGRWKSRSPMFIRLIEHIVRWELLGNATFITPDFYPQRFPVAERLAKLIPESGRWMVVLVRGLGLHCVPMLHCILHGLRSDSPKMRDVEGHPGAIFCAGAATCVRFALESIVENDGKPPSILSQEYWKTLAHVGECLMSWCIGGKRYLHEIPEESIVSDKKMRSRAVARKAVLAGLAGDDIDNWGIAVAKGAPLMLSALAQTETVSQQTMDGVSGVLFLLSRLITKEARTDPRWRNALRTAKTSTLPKEIITSLFECQTWANEVTAAVKRTMAGETPIDALIEKESNDSASSEIKKSRKRPAPGSEMQSVQNFDFRDPKNTRKGIRFGFLIALVATWSHGEAGFVDAKYLDKFIDNDDDDLYRETKHRKKNISTPTKRSAMEASAHDSATATSSTHLFKIVLSSLERCGDGLLAAVEPLARIGWALDGENSGIRGVLQQIGKSKFLGEFSGEFPVHSPSQQLVDMIQLLLHAAIELRNFDSNGAGDTVHASYHHLESPREILESLLHHANWKRSFSCLECIAPNMFYFGSSLDLVGAANVVFPPSFRVLRLRNDLKRLLRDMHGNVPHISAKLRRAMPCDDAWRAIKNAIGPLLGRTFTCSFDSEDGVGNGVAREAWTVLIQALLEGHPTRVGPNEAVFTSWSNAKALRTDSMMSLSAMHGGGDNDNPPSFEGALGTLRSDCSPHAARFAGRIVGLLISNEKTADLPLVPWLWQALLHKPLKAELLAQVDDDFKRTLLPIKTCDWNDPKISWVKEDPPAFTIAAPTRADPNRVKELLPGGANVFVDEHNRGEYVDLYAQQCMLRCSTAPINNTSGMPPSSSSSPSLQIDESDTITSNQDIRVNLAAFTSGFDEVVPRELVSSWECEDLELLVCGLQDIDVAAWEQATTYDPKPPPNSTAPGVVAAETRSRWFWDAVKSMNSEQKHALLHFWTAFRKLPHTGFRGLRFKLRFDDQKSAKHLPMAQTCFLTLRVPKYVSQEETKEKLVKAISECCFGFGFS